MQFGYNMWYFSRIFKKALIIPVHKSGPRDRVDNYRPISARASMFKVLEKIMDFQKQKKSCPLYNLTFGNAVHELTNYMFKNTNGQKKCLAILLDFTKAFDTVSVPGVGNRCTQFSLFDNYLCNILKSEMLSLTIYQSCTVFHRKVYQDLTLFLVYVNKLWPNNFFRG